MTGDPNETPLPTEQLAADLRRLGRVGPAVPDEVDRCLRGRIDAHFAGRRPLRLPRLVPWAAAALVLIAAGVRIMLLPSAPAPSDGPAGARADAMDIDANGRVDILDAYALARRLADGAAVEPAWDVNTDGTVDDRDVDRIAQRAVALDGGAA